jgi:DNA-binding GntR family transcriptional regulator
MPISRGERSVHVYRILREQIVEGTLAAGARVVEAEVAAELGVGRTPVREALQMLLQEELLIAAPGGRRQLSVAPLSADEARELFGLLAELEASALRTFASWPRAKRAALIGDAARANLAFASAAARVPVDPAEAYATHHAFHAALIAPLAGPRLAWLLSMLRPQADRYEWFVGPALQGSLEVAVAEHAAVLGALEAGDADAAADALRTNWRNAGDRLARAIGARRAS